MAGERESSRTRAPLLAELASPPLSLRNLAGPELRPLLHPFAHPPPSISLQTNSQHRKKGFSHRTLLLSTCTMSDFLPASAASTKARKLAQKKAASHPPTQGSKSKKSSSTFLSTQPTPSPSAIQQDAEMSEFERLPMDHRSAEQKAAALNGSGSAHKVTNEQATAAMDMDQDDDDDDEDDSIMIDPSSLSLPTPVTRTPISQIQGSDSLSFPAVAHVSTSGLTQRRKVGIPPHRMTPLKRDWIKIYSPLVEECGLQVRMNMHKRWVEMKVSSSRTPPRARVGEERPPKAHRRTLSTPRARPQTSKHTPSPSSLTRAADFLSAYALGFAVDDAIALLRLEELYIVRLPPSRHFGVASLCTPADPLSPIPFLTTSPISAWHNNQESFEIKDIKTLHGDHLSRAIGRIAGHEGKTRFVIENASRTRIVLADTCVLLSLPPPLQLPPARAPLTPSLFLLSPPPPDGTHTLHSKIHILGTFSNIKIARDSISALVLGSPPGKIYANLRKVASRSRERF